MGGLELSKLTVFWEIIASLKRQNPVRRGHRRHVKTTGEVCPDGEKNDRIAFQARADLQNQAIGWLRKGYSSLGGGTVVRFP